MKKKKQAKSPWRKFIPGFYAKGKDHPVPHRDRMGVK